MKASLTQARYASMALFFVAGLVFGSWGVEIPVVKEKYGLNDASLSLALFAVAVGSIAALSRVGPWISRVGATAASTAGGLTMAVAAALILQVPSFLLLLAVLLVMGFGMAVLDVAMNADAAAVEAAAGRPIMSALHGMFSVGGMVGAAAGGAALSHGMRPEVHLALSAVVGAAIVLAARPALFSRAHPRRRDADADAAAAAPRRKRRALLGLGMIALIALIAEGAMYDWATVYMRDVVHASHGVASAAYALFSTGMAAGRFGGDRVRQRFGSAQVVLYSGSLACIGIIAGLLLPYPATALAGFTLMGLGLANMMPVMFIAAANAPGVPAAEGIARVAGLAYIGMLIGPVLIGAVAQATTLPAGLSVVALCAAVVAGLGPRTVRSHIARAA
jgi:fucose permease